MPRSRRSSEAKAVAGGYDVKDEGAEGQTGEVSQVIQLAMSSVDRHLERVKKPARESVRRLLESTSPLVLKKVV